jgi:hypothetical protein
MDEGKKAKEGDYIRPKILAGHLANVSKYLGDKGQVRGCGWGAFCAAILVGLPLFVYYRTLSPTVNLIDSGELISMAYLLGIAHPTGYPLYTLMGRLSCLVGGATPAISMNFMSALFGALSSMAAGVITFLSLDSRRAGGPGEPPLLARYTVSTVSGLLFAFSRTLWRVSTETEVYSMAVFLFGVLLLVAWWSIDGEEGMGGDHRPGLRAFPVIGYAWGLAMGDHMSIVFFAPVIAYIFWRRRTWRKGRRGALPCFFAFFLLGLSTYIYLPIRAMRGPLLNWGDPADLDSLVRHMTAWQYRVWMFSGGLGDLLNKFGAYARLLASQFHPAIIVLVIPGFFFLAGRRRPILVALVLIYLSDLVYSLNYDIPDIDPYYLPSFFVVVVVAGAGLYRLVAASYRFRRGLASAIIAASFLLPLSALRSNYRICDRSRDFMAGELADNLLSTVSMGAVVLTRNWDLYAPVLYEQFVEGKRRDVVMIDYELMRRSWYVRELMASHRDLFRGAEPQVMAFLGEVADFEAGRSFDSRMLDNSFNAMLTAVLTVNYPGQPAYIDFDDDPKIAPSLKRDPQGVIFELREEYRHRSFDRSGYRLRSTLDPSVYRDDRELLIRSLYPWYAVKEGVILRGLGDYGEAAVSLENALIFEPDNPAVLDLLGDSYLRMHSLSRALGCYRRLVAVSPGNVSARERLEEIEHLIRESS